MQKITLLILVSFLFCLTTFSQSKADSAQQQRKCQPKEIGEILFKKPEKAPDTTRKKDVFLLPYIAYSPTKGFQIGVGGTFSWYRGKSRITNQSAASATAEFTSKDQKIFQLKTNIYTDENRWFLQGDWRYYIYSLPTYGLGTGYNNPVPEVPGYTVNPDSTNGWDDPFQVTFKWLKIHEIFSYQIVKNLYAGLGYHLDYHFEINDEKLNRDSSATALTPHYAYSTLHGFNPEEYISAGISMNFVFDSRDNLISPYKGYYVNVNYRLNKKWLGGDQSGSQLWTEFRTYIGLEKKLPRHLLAFWTYGAFQLSGEIPYFDLWAIGFDQMNSSGRGYLQGRWRGENLVYGEMQYRFPISRCTQVLGGVLFLNASTASSKDANIPLFGYVRPAGGLGLRVMVSKASRTNVSIDFTVGEKQTGIYFSAMETF